MLLLIWRERRAVERGETRGDDDAGYEEEETPAQTEPVAVLQAETVEVLQADSVAILQVETVEVLQADSVAILQTETVEVLQADSVAILQAQLAAVLEIEQVVAQAWGDIPKG